MAETASRPERVVRLLGDAEQFGQTESGGVLDADALYISQRTASTHVGAILRKLGVYSFPPRGVLGYFGYWGCGT